MAVWRARADPRGGDFAVHHRLSGLRAHGAHQQRAPHQDHHGVRGQLAALRRRAHLQDQAHVVQHHGVRAPEQPVAGEEVPRAEHAHVLDGLLDPDHGRGHLALHLPQVLQHQHDALLGGRGAEQPFRGLDQPLLAEGLHGREARHNGVPLADGRLHHDVHAAARQDVEGAARVVGVPEEGGIRLRNAHGEVGRQLGEGGVAEAHEGPHQLQAARGAHVVHFAHRLPDGLPQDQIRGEEVLEGGAREVQQHGGRHHGARAGGPHLAALEDGGGGDVGDEVVLAVHVPQLP
mmetsp:Transcript_50603/g.161926  ORF Transcript_50603/g.161926 Transcript_50603/m.161926 type:complete len:290 (-) Transcript_50603:3443-4312(-)